jgi:hypothetical protein
MKFICPIFLIMQSVAFVSCDSNQASAKKTVTEDTVPQISFRSESAELGQSPFKKHANHDFVFSNTGNTPLTIKEVRGNCHCVQGKWPDHPINPGDSAIINVSFDPEEVTGRYIRTLIVRSNAKRDSVQLTITGEILPRSK